MKVPLASAAKIKRGQPVTAPGIPPGFPNASKLVTADCIQSEPARI